jgi:serine/threonine protein kinase
LQRELDVLWRLQTSSRGQSNQFIVQCLHQELVSSSSTDASISPSHPPHATPILATTSLLSLSSPSADPNQLSVPPNPMVGLVLECGGPNLREFVDRNHHSLDTIHRVHILRDVVNALGFLHDQGIVHGDLKPENIVSFSFLGEGMVRWKLVDLEHSHDLRADPPPLLSPHSACTPEYSAPELLKVLAGGGGRGGDALLVSPRLDIWSLGMVSVYALRGCTVWRLLSPGREFSWAMVREWDESVSLKQLLSFLDDCLRSRLSCRKLLAKSLFSTSNSTIQGNVLKTMSGEMSRQLGELREFVLKLMESSGEMMSSDLNELLVTLAVKLEGRQG